MECTHWRHGPARRATARSQDDTIQQGRRATARSQDETIQQGRSATARSQDDTSQQGRRATVRSQDDPMEQTIAIDDMTQGTGHIVWAPACRDEELPIVCNEEQVDFLALQIWDIEKALRDRQDGATSPVVLPDPHVLVGGQAEAIRSQYLQSNDRGIIAGGGGYGKTTMLKKAICLTYETFFHSTDRASPSNKTARLVKGKTIHRSMDSGQQTH